jgi:hypothetical protein
MTSVELASIAHAVNTIRVAFAFGMRRVFVVHPHVQHVAWVLHQSAPELVISFDEFGTLTASRWSA